MSAPHDRPTASELIESVKEWLERDVMPSVEGRLQFHTRVAMNVLDIVMREMESGAEQEVRHRAVLDSFGVADDAELASQIRLGAFDGELLSVLERLRPIVEDKVKVANPRYLG